MPAFRYTVINQKNEKLSGILNAATPDDARKELNTLGFAVLTLEDVSTIKVPTPIDQPQEKSESVSISLKFAFTGMDKTNRRVRGNIAAQDINQAYARLLEEYHFLIEELRPANAQMSAQEATQLLRTVKDAYERTKILQENQGQGLMTQEQEEEKTALLENVDFILKKINEVLTAFGDEIKPEMKKAIRDDVDRLLRIKTSNNLASIRQTCKELLQRIQDRETFLHKESRVKEKTELQLETETMMKNLTKKGGAEKEKVQTRETTLTRILTKLIPEDPPAIKEKKEKIAAINEQLKSYAKLWISADKNYRQEMKTGIKTLWEERKRMKNEIKNLTAQEQEEKKAARAHKPTKIEKLYREIYIFTLWLLCGYLGYYFVMTIVDTKEIPLVLPSFFAINIYQTNTFFPLLITLFVIHAGVSLQTLFYPKAIIGKLLTMPVTLFFVSFLLINFF